MKKFLKISDVLILCGLALLGTGLYISFGIGTAATVIGILITALGIALNIGGN